MAKGTEKSTELGGQEGLVQSSGANEAAAISGAVGADLGVRNTSVERTPTVTDYGNGIKRIDY